MLRSRWSNIVFKMHALTEDKSDDSKGSFCEELEQVLGNFTRYHVKIPLEIFNKKNWKKRVFSNRNLGMIVYIKIVMIMVLE